MVSAVSPLFWRCEACGVQNTCSKEVVPFELWQAVPGFKSFWDSVLVDGIPRLNKFTWKRAARYVCFGSRGERDHLPLSSICVRW